MEAVAAYLEQCGINVSSGDIANSILAHYKKDYTFSVPILTMCALCGVGGERAFSRIPQLPFELALLPRRFYRFLNLSVVSYAVPALIAVGIVIHRHKTTSRHVRGIREALIPRAMRKLETIMPESGGFLEAIPLTAFVCLSLIKSGFGDSEVVQQGIGFLLRSRRPDGSWPIDVDLSTWVTTLSVKALGSKIEDVLSREACRKIAWHLLSVQNKSVHPFNGTGPGGWGWTNYSGSVPDGDDTPGAILALLRLLPSEEVLKPVSAGIGWMIRLQNRDGGLPTFSRGWGKLPFDESCADLTGHFLLALSAFIHTFPRSATPKHHRAFNRAMNYLAGNQRADGSWLPLWFGNQYTENHHNPVYGTARVAAYLRDIEVHSWLNASQKAAIRHMTEGGRKFLLSVQNPDGSWGGDQHIPGTIEETSLAVAALAGNSPPDACVNAMRWLHQQPLKPSPIGLYFASLWYDEEMYPLTMYLEAVVRMKDSL